MGVHTRTCACATCLTHTPIASEGGRFVAGVILIDTLCRANCANLSVFSPGGSERARALLPSSKPWKETRPLDFMLEVEVTIAFTPTARRRKLEFMIPSRGSVCCHVLDQPLI